MNQVTLLGRLVADPKTFNIDNNKQMTSFTIATGYDKYTEFTECVAFENQAKLIRDHCQKGTMLGLVGHLQTRKFTDKNGQERKSTQVIVSNLTLTSSNKTEQTSQQTSYTEPVKKHNPYNNFDPSDDFDGPKLDITSDDLPF